MLKILEALTLLAATRAVLGLAIQALRFGTRSVEAAFAGAIVAARFRRSLLIILASRSLLVAFCPLPVRLRLVHRVPAAVVILLPAVAGVFVNIPIVPGIHIATGGFCCRRVSPSR